METKPRDRKFETLFDGDEIDGKFYGLTEGVTGLDAATALYLTSTGRLAEIDDKRYAELVAKAKDGKKASEKAPPANEKSTEAAEEKAAREAEETAQAEQLKVAREDFEAKRIPDDLIDPAKPDSDADRLVGKAKLEELATAAGAEAKGNKTELAVAIMAARAKAQANETN